MPTILYKIIALLLIVNSGQSQGETHDFVVVGLGSAGCVLINKLSSNADFSVLGLEAGGYKNPLNYIPGYAPLAYYTENNYGYTMELQTNMSLGLEQQRAAFSAGKGLGGSSLINWMMHIIPNRKDFDSWAAAGNTGWESEIILKDIRKFEKANIPDPNPVYRGINGTFNCQMLPHRTKGVHTFIKAASQMGLPIIPDYNGEIQQQGAAYLQATLKNGLRGDTYTQFVEPIRRRKNLRIRPHSKALRIIIDQRTKTANGVLYFHFPTLSFRRVYARKEVIISAGVFNSPKLLMLSGIGPEDDLNTYNIKVLQNLAVGSYMKDHISFPAAFFRAKEKVNTNAFKTLLNPFNYVRLFGSKEGPLTIPGLAVEGVGFISTNVSDHGGLTDMELIFLSGTISSDNGLFFRGFLRISHLMYRDIYLRTENHPVWMIAPMYYRPVSTGYVKLRSRNPFDDLLLHGNYFTDEKGIDMRSMIAAIRYIQKLGATEAFQAIGSEQVIPTVTGCTHTTLDSDEYWECLIRHVGLSLWHQVGTCKMGPKSDSSAVVDPTLKVYGINNLRVADNSIAPTVTGCHSNLLAVIIGYRASEMILQEYS